MNVVLLKKPKPLLEDTRFLFIIALVFSIIASCISYIKGWNIAYGDAESHLNIAKRVLSSPTPGFSQLGGIWLPLPHLLMIPFIYFDPLWRTGLAGTFVSSLFYIISSIYIYKLIYLITKKPDASLLGFFIFAGNPNILYMQTTPLSEMTLIGFFILSLYYFTKYLEQNILSDLVLAGFFGFGASLCRYDGWFLIIIECLILLNFFLFNKNKRNEWLSKFLLFSTPALFGILLWLLWDLIILGDAFYFSNSPFSAKAQQYGFFLRGELPAYNNIFLSFLYYFYTAGANIGIIIFVLSIGGLVFFKMNDKTRWYLPWILCIPFVFYVLTLYLGQSVIFIPMLTPETFKWNLFNVRYGIMMVPAAAFFTAYLFSESPKYLYILILFGLFFQSISFISGYESIITIQDGTIGLSRTLESDVQRWLTKNYDGGYVLLDDYAKPVSIIRTPISLDKIIYIGNKPYWENSFVTPEKYEKWIIMQKGDSIWSVFNDQPDKRAHLYKYYNKVYTSSQILVFKRINNDSQVELIHK